MTSQRDENWAEPAFRIKFCSYGKRKMLETTSEATKKLNPNNLKEKGLF